MWVIYCKSERTPIVWMVIGGIIIVASFFAFTANVGAGLCVLLLGVAVLCLGFYLQNTTKTVGAEKCIRYDEKTHVLYLINRSSLIKYVVSLIEDKDYKISYEPEAINYTSVTVGGVTTGGAYKTGGYNYISSTENNNLYRLTYGEKYIIDRIQLDDEQYAEAKSSCISQYLNNEKQIMVNVYTNAPVNAGQKMLHNLKTTGHVGNEFKGYPTYEKASAILSWICGE
ncbi:MAG: hypothetical protein Q4A88_00675 [Clostridia bacterium]|nr:hypothetical protein [Clostridia bacterium]